MEETRWQTPNDVSEHILLLPKVGLIYANRHMQCFVSYPLQVDKSALHTNLKSGCSQRLVAEYWYDIRIHFHNILLDL